MPDAPDDGMRRQFAFSESERAHLQRMRAPTVDAHGREVLVGLSFEETAWYVMQTHTILGRHRADRLRYVELHRKHKTALETISACAGRQG